MRTIHRGTLAVATLALAAAAGCSSAAGPPSPPPSPPPAPSSPPAAAPTPVAAPPTTTTPPASGPPRDGTDVSACADGDCEVEIRGTKTFAVRGSQGRTTLTIRPVPPDGLRIDPADGGTIEATGGGSQGGFPEGFTITQVRGDGASVVVRIARS